MQNDMGIIQLQQQWWRIFVWSWVGYAGILLWLNTIWSTTTLITYAIVTALVLLAFLLILRSHLSDNHRSDETAILPAFGPGNIMSITRGWMLAIITGFLVTPWPELLAGWLPALLYTVGSIADIFDGYAARRANHATVLGEKLDIELDGFGVLLVSLFAVVTNKVPWWFVILAFSRQLFVAGLRWRERRGQINHPTPPSLNRRIIAGLFIGFLTVMLWPVVQPPGTLIAGYIFAASLILSFGRDWLVVIGWMDPESASYARYWNKPRDFAQSWLPVALRVLLVGLLMSAWISGRQLDWPAILELYGRDATPLATWAMFIFNGLALFGVVGVFAGILPRFTVLFIIFFVAGDILVNHLDWLNGTLLAICCYLGIAGNGLFNLWQPEEHKLFRRRLGT